MKTKIIRKCWNIILTFILIIALFFVIAFIGVRLIGLTPYIVTSGSMEPQYPVGSLIYVKEVKPENINVGDAITFYMGEDKVVATHQVYEIDRENQMFYTQGINNKDSNGNIIHDVSPVSSSSIIGIPVFHIPYLGHINKMCTTTPGIYILVGIAIIILIISFLLDDNGRKNK